MNEETQQLEIEIVEEVAVQEVTEEHLLLVEEQLAEDSLFDGQSAEAPVAEADSETAPMEEASREKPLSEELSSEELSSEELASQELAFQSDSPEEEVSASSDTLDETIQRISSEDDSKEVANETVSIETAELPVEAAAESGAAVEEQITATRDELKPAIECLLFVADEPLPFKQLCKVLGDVSEEDVLWALGELAAEYDARSSGLEVREIAGGWRISTRPQNHEFIRKYLKSRPSARLSLPALETLAVIAYKQPITIPEILEIRGVSSSSAIKTLLEKRLIVTKGRKETVGKPMMYGTSKEFMIQFGLKDLNELPSIEDFEDLTQ